MTPPQASKNTPTSLALFPRFLADFSVSNYSSARRLGMELLCVAAGVLLMGLLAQLRFYLPLSPVPFTGQTFGLYALLLLWGSKRAGAVFLSYLLLGYLGLPLFALSGAMTWGYLLGMLVAAVLVGRLADKGMGETFTGALLCSALAAVIVFAGGLVGLSFFIAADQLLLVGLYPFVFGETVKVFAVASMVTALSYGLRSKKGTL